MSGGDRVKQLFKKYGKVAIGVHFTVYFSFLAGAQAGEHKCKGTVKGSMTCAVLEWHQPVMLLLPQLGDGRVLSRPRGDSP